MNINEELEDPSVARARIAQLQSELEERDMELDALNNFKRANEQELVDENHRQSQLY